MPIGRMEDWTEKTGFDFNQTSKINAIQQIAVG
jgi:hypothetical protein